MKMVAMDTHTQNPELEFPTEWTYTIIGTDSGAMSSAVASIFTTLSYSLNDSKRSSGGKYVSLEIRTRVESKEQKDLWYHALASSKDIKMVL
jgi:putative lipoic acid-binding regulatory protein